MIETEKIKGNHLEKLLESLLFVAGEPITIKKLSKITKKSETSIKSSLEKLKDRLKETSGLILLIKSDKAQLVSSKEYSDFIEKLFKQERKEELTKAALEVLAIVAYQGPVTRNEIETIRGVNSSYILRSLLIRGLINKLSDKSTKVAYDLSFETLKRFGLEKKEELPEWHQVRREIEKVKNVFTGAEKI